MTAAAVELLHSTQCSCTVELLHSARCKLRGSGVAHGSPVLPGLLPGTEAPPDLSSLHAHAQPPSTAHCPDRCSPGYSTRPVAPTMASLQAHPTPPHNLSLHALRCHISSAVRTSGGSSQVFLCVCVCARTYTCAHACDLTGLWVPSGLRFQSFGFSARICRLSGTVCWSGVEVCSSSPRGQSGVGLQSAPQPRCAQVLLRPCPLGLGWVCSGGPVYVCIYT